MLRVNVGLSRKLSKDYNSIGYSINIDGEILALVGETEAVMEQVKELFDLAEEALDLQIERATGEAAMGSHDQNGSGHRGSSNGGGRSGNGRASNDQNGNGHPDETATNKQIQYLLTLAKRQRLSTIELERRIADILGYEVGLYDLTKKAAGTVIDALNGSGANGNRPARK